jgi:hypothetical protein
VTDHETDPIVQRAVDELKRLPALDQAAVRRIAGAAAAARLTPADDPTVMSSRPRGRWLATLGLAAAALAGFIARDFLSSNRGSAIELQRGTTPAVAPVRAVASTSGDVALVPQQCVLENTTARRVSVVGDFNNWNPNTTPMVRSSDGSLWSAIVPIVPGRHVYGFMVNDSVFTLDPRMPKARDPDLGADASVVMVGRP